MNKISKPTNIAFFFIVIFFLLKNKNKNNMNHVGNRLNLQNMKLCGPRSY